MRGRVFGVAFLGLVLWASASLSALAASTGKDEDPVVWRQVSHADFAVLYEQYPSGFTLIFFDDADVVLAEEFHAPDGTVYLDDDLSEDRQKGVLDYGGNRAFCYSYFNVEGAYCWYYFRRGDLFREESTDGDVVDFFRIHPGNLFQENLGPNWRDHFD